MSIQPPKIDNRSYEDIVKQTEELVKKYTDWKPHSEGKADAGMALIRIFGHMATLVSDRLNQVPDKNFLAFLDLIGTEPLPPQPAKVPLTFYLAEGSSVDAVVPAHTQVAAPPAEGREDEVVFETDRELVVTTAQLKAVFVREPGKDLYSDRTLQATGKKDAAFGAFAGEQPIEHCLYLADDELFTLPGNKTVTIKFGFTDQQTDLTKLPISWSYWDGSWRSLSPQTTNQQVKIQDLPVPTQLTINGREARWLRASVNSHPKGTNVSLSTLLTINHITATVDFLQNDLKPDLCFFNTVPIDLSKDFYPFGEQPRFNDTLYIASQEVFARPGAVVTIDLKLSDGLPVKTNGGVEIAWEAWNGYSWKQSNDQDKKKSTILSNSQSAIQLTGNGKVSLTLPSEIVQGTVNGETSYWIRARIVKGDYGKQAVSRQSKDQDNNPILENKNYPIYEFIEASFQPPSLKSLSISYSYQASSSLSACCAYNDFHYKDILTTALRENASSGQKILKLASVAGFAIGDRLWIDSKEEQEIEAINLEQKTVTLLSTLTQSHVINTKVLQSFQPFKKTADLNPTLYLGFDKQFANRPITLFAQVEPPQPGEALKEESSDTETVQLVWEYCSPSGWSSLGVQDETKGFAERGLIQFIGPTDLTKSSEFGQELYWLRVRWEAGEFRVPPRLKRILTNTMWATQATTLTNEILGSSDGNPNQIFQTVQKPVLQGEQLEVQEGKIPSLEEKGNNEMNVVRDETGQIEAVWVRWQKVRDFYGSGSRDRHYVLDRLTGEVRFGDGQYGMVPPLGRNNIRLSQYQIGGGTRGNLAANTVVQLKTTVPYIEKVTNLEAAVGGSEQESLEQVKERGPKWLRHRGRAVTWQDFEDLAYEASPEVARVKAITPELKTPEFNPLDPKVWIDRMSKASGSYVESNIKNNVGQVALIIVPRSDVPQPTPSIALLDKVNSHIQQRCAPTVKLNVVVPQWQEVKVKAEIVPVSLEKSEELRTKVVKKLEIFLHPLLGGNGDGWDFGRSPHESNIYSLIQSIPGIERVQSLEIIVGDLLFYSSDISQSTSASKDTWKKSAKTNYFNYLICSGKHQVSIKR